MAMQMIIAETGKRETLSAVDQSTGVDWSREIIGNSGAIGDYIRYDRAADVYLISQDGYDWWVDYLMTVEADEQELSDLRDEYDGDTVQAMLNDEWYGSGHDYNDHHAINQRAFCRIRGTAATHRIATVALQNPTPSARTATAHTASGFAAGRTAEGGRALIPLRTRFPGRRG